MNTENWDLMKAARDDALRGYVEGLRKQKIKSFWKGLIIGVVLGIDVVVIAHYLIEI